MAVRGPDGAHPVAVGDGAVGLPPPDEDRPLAVRSVERTLASRYSTYINEVQRLIDAGRTVMEREQTLNPRVSDIVAEAGLSNQAFYRHFRSKSELMLAILDANARQMAGYLEARMAKEPSGVAKIRAWVEGTLAQTVMDRAASISRGVMLSTLELRAEYPQESDRPAAVVRRPLIEAVRLAEEQGEITTPDAEVAAAMVFRLTMDLMENWLFTRQVPSRAEVEALEHFLLHGLGAHDGPGRGSAPPSTTGPAGPA